MAQNRSKEEQRARILAAAEEVFRAKGFVETKMIDIARRAEVSPSTIYLYFDGKKKLFNALNIPEAEEMRPQYDRRRERITRIALAQFAARGYEATTMDDIAREIGFSKASLYLYCSGKEDLFLQVLQLYTHATPPEEAVAGANIDDWRQALHNIGQSYMAILRDPERAAFMDSVIRESHKFPEFGRAYYERSFCTARSNISAFLLRLQREGEIRGDLDVHVAVTTFLGTLNSYLFMYDTMKGTPRDDVDVQKFIRTTVELFIRGIER